MAFALATATAKGIPGCVPSVSDTLDFCMEWDADNQLKWVTKNGAEVARFAYDPLGRRVEKVAGGVTTGYTYDRSAIVREVRDETTLKYVHGRGIDTPLGADDGTTPLYFHPDALGSIAKITNAAAAVTLAREYDAWGNLQVAGCEPGYAFTGREWDPETGLYYYRARYYDPRNARFISEDPIGFLGGPAFYTYVGNRPANVGDPFGLTDQTIPFPKEYPRPPRPPGGPRGRIFPFPSPEPDIPGPGDVLKETGKGLARAGLAIANIVIWTCVAVEAYCASREGVSFCACMQAAQLPWDCPGGCEPTPLPPIQECPDKKCGQ